MIRKAQKRLGGGVAFLTAYSWSRTEDSTWAASNFLNASQTYPQDVYNPGAEWSRSVFDIPHRFKLAATYQLPFGRGRRFSAGNSFVDYVIGTWSFNPIPVIQSGSPLAIYQNTNNNSKIGASLQ